MYEFTESKDQEKRFPVLIWPRDKNTDKIIYPPERCERVVNQSYLGDQAMQKTMQMMSKLKERISIERNNKLKILIDKLETVKSNRQGEQ